MIYVYLSEGYVIETKLHLDFEQIYSIFLTFQRNKGNNFDFNFASKKKKIIFRNAYERNYRYPSVDFFYLLSLWYNFQYLLMVLFTVIHMTYTN